MSPRARRLRFGALCVLGYVALSWAFRFDMRLGQQIISLSYPFDTFSMYAHIFKDDMSHLLIRDAQGAVHHVDDFRTFDCEQPVEGSTAKCMERRGIQYHWEDLMRYIETHKGAGGFEVDLISRTWRVLPGKAPVQLSDCVISHCKVTR